jgi:putative two-component system response regulator
MEVPVAKILVVDDEPHVCEIICRWLSAEGHSCASAFSGERAIELLEQDKFQLLITDIVMPGMSGLDLLTFVKSRFSDVAVLMITAVDDRTTAAMSFELGAYGYILKPFAPQDVVLNVANALERRRSVIFAEECKVSLDETIRHMALQIKEREEEMVRRLVLAVALITDETTGHARRLGMCAAELAKYLRWDRERVETIRLAAPLHDVGKLGISDEILSKNEKLTQEELDVVRQHTVIGARLLEGSAMPLLRMARDIALSHHEKWDGSGYPQGISGQLIPEAARLVAILDVYDTLTHERPYRTAFSEEKALSIMTAYRHQMFDPRMFDYFVTLLPALRRIQEEVRD